MKMSPLILILGSMMVFMSSVFLMVIMPVLTLSGVGPSAIWRPWTEDERKGHELYVNNGCSYCHSLYIRNTDWDIGAERIAEAGDYYNHQPAVLGTERTGPDLSQDGGEHPDDWHLAHFINPRFTRPESLMPAWEFLGEEKLRYLTAYVQSQGLKDADFRMQRQREWHSKAITAFAGGPDANIRWLHSQVPEVWRNMPSPYPPTAASLARGHKIYQFFCIGCHGPVGDGMGPAQPYLRPTPLNFTTLRRNLEGGRYIGGLLYYQIMNGITGTSMPYFKKDLESEKIWDVGNYISVYFIGYSDSNLEPRGIDASFEPVWENQFPLPVPPLEKGERP
jgi:cytochrome c oxidase cbb3-type subunit 2/cytochrome c oxidase cbb3-type subunit I/II